MSKQLDGSMVSAARGIEGGPESERTTSAQGCPQPLSGGMMPDDCPGQIWGECPTLVATREHLDLVRKMVRMIMAWVRAHPGELSGAFVPMLVNLELLCADGAQADEPEGV